MMRIVWLAPYNVLYLEPELFLNRHLGSHSCSWIVNLSRELVKRDNIELHLITESPLVKQSTSVVKGGITFHVLKSGAPFTNRGYPSYFNLEVLQSFRPNIKRLVNCARRLQADIVHAYGTENSYSLAALELEVPAIISMQGILNIIMKDENHLHARKLKSAEMQAVKRATYFDCRTSLDTTFVRENNPNATIFTIRRAIHNTFFSEPWQQPDTCDLLFVGSVIERKGIEVLIDALAKIAAVFPQVALHIVGSCSPVYREKLESMASAAGVRQRLYFLGHLTAEEIAAEHMRCRMLVFPSFFENSPNGVAEAMVSGLPVVASRVGGIPSMIEHEKTGLLTEPGNASELAKAVCRILADDSLAKAIGRAAAGIARERHSPALVADQVLEAYHRVLQREKQVTAPITS